MQRNVTSKSPVGDISVVTLIGTDTTLDHSQNDNGGSRGKRVVLCIPMQQKGGYLTAKVDPALSISPPASSSAILSELHFSSPWASSLFPCVWRKSIFASSLGGSSFFECVMFLGFFVRDGHSNLISTNDFQYTINSFILINESPLTWWPCFRTLVWYFPSSTMLADWIGVRPNP